MLASHPDLLVTPECGFALWLAEAFSSRDCESRDVRSDYARQVYACRKFSTWGIALEQLQDHLQRCKATDYGELAAEIYHCYGKLIAKKSYCRWGDKNNFYLNLIGEIAALYKDAQFIHIVRDGRDVACSYKEINERKHSSQFAPQLPGEVEAIAEEWCRNVLEARGALSKLASNRTCEVRFSELVENTEVELAKLCQFLGVDYSSRMLDYHLLNVANQMEPPELMPWKQNTLSVPRKDRLGRYRCGLSSKEIRAFEAVAGDVLRLYSFPLHTDAA